MNSYEISYEIYTSYELSYELSYEIVILPMKFHRNLQAFVQFHGHSAAQQFPG